MPSVSEIMKLLNDTGVTLFVPLHGIRLILNLLKGSPLELDLKRFTVQLEKMAECPINVIFESGQIALSNYAEVAIPPTQVVPRNEAACLVLALLERLPFNSAAPDASLVEFLDFHRRRALIESDNKSLIDIDNVRAKGVKDSVVLGVKDCLLRLKQENENRSEDIMELAAIYSELCGIQKNLELVVRIGYDAYNGRKFTELLPKPPRFVIGPEGFCNWFVRGLSSLRLDGKDESSQSLIAHYHNYVMRYIDFSWFLAAFPEHSRFDRLISKASDEMIRSFCVDPAPLSARKLFSSSAFEEAILMMKKGRTYEIPLIALPKISSAIEILNQMYFLANECPAQADALTPLVHYLLLKCAIPDIYSYVRYLDEYTRPLIDIDVLVLPEVLGVGLTHMVNHLDSLVRFLQDQKREAKKAMLAE
jgi:hypothetical protein